MRIVLHPEARQELRAAAIWYDEQRAGLGDDFVEEISAVLERAAVTPQAVPLWPGVRRMPEPIRRAVVQRFPYVLAFQVHEDRIFVLAVAHARRRPLYWLRRAR